MLKFLAVLGGVLATLVAVFMLAINLGWLEPKEEPIVETQNPTTAQSESPEEAPIEQIPENPVSENGYKDGIYKAEAPIFDVTTGWKAIVTVEIKNGKLYNVVWDEEYKDGGSTKKELSSKGEYMMAENSIPWHKQAIDAADYIMDMENPDELSTVDAISSVTIDSGPFLELVKLCVAAAKVQ